MTRTSALTTPRTPSQADIDAGVSRGRSLRAHALLDAVGSLFSAKAPRHHASDF